MSANTSRPSTGAPGCSGRFELVTIGVSTGGVDLLMALLPALPADFPAPLLVCLHAPAGTTASLVETLDRRSRIRVVEAQDQQLLQPGTACLGPGGYHLLVERDGRCGLSVDAPVKYARPSVDVLFDSAAQVYRERLLAVILSGAGDDGADGVRRVRQLGGAVIVQDPASAQLADMPRAALQAVHPDHIVKPEHLAALLLRLCREGAPP